MFNRTNLLLAARNFPGTKRRRDQWLEFRVFEEISRRRMLRRVVEKLLTGGVIA